MGRTRLTANLARTLLPALLLGLTCLGAHAQSGNALDRIDFGTPASEAAHAFDPAGGALPPSGTGAFGQTYRQPYGAGATLTSQSELVFALKCDPNLQNYLTVRLWGSDTQGEYLWLANNTGPGPLDSNGGPPPFPNRFHYETITIPISWTQGQTSVQLTLYPGSADTSKPTRPIYSAFTHTEPRFVPNPNDPTGVKAAQDGYLAPTAALTQSQVIVQLQALRQSIYGSGGYYNSLIANQIPADTTGAPPEVIGLHLNNSIASEVSANLTPEQWRNDAYNGGGGGPGYSKLPDQMISALVSTYFLPPFTDGGGNVVAGLDHYHDSSIITRLVSAFDGCSYLQVGDGGFGQNYGEWQGLCSTPRDSTSQWPNTTARAPGWSLSLEGVDSQTLGYAIIQLLNDPTAVPILKNYLSQSYDADFSGTLVLRATAYERMLSNHAHYLYNLAGGTESQNLFQELGMYACEIALDKLQALYPNANYTGVGPAAAVTRMEQVLGLVQDTTMGGTDPAYYGSGGAGLVNYGISLGGFGEAHGLLSSGYDGRYGQILPWLAPDYVRLAALDPSVPAPVLSQAEAMTRATIDGFDQFISPGDNAGYSSGQFYDHFTLAQEDFITYRDPYNPSADGNSFEVNSQYPASDPTGVLSDAYALRAAYLQSLYGITPSVGSGGHAYVQYLKDLGAYESTLRSLINVDPATLKPLPGEPGQPNFAFVDAQTGTVSVSYNGERFYMNANWRNFEYANPQQFGYVSNYARIHDTTGTVDLAALIDMPHDATTVQNDGNLSGALSKGWVVRYGPFLLAGNNTEDGSSPYNITISLPAGTGSAQELVSGRTYALGSSVTLTPGQGAAFVLPGAGSTGNGTAPTLADGYYTLTNAGSGLLADDQGNGTAPGAPVDQAAGTGGFPQKWFLSNLGGGNVRLTNPYSNLVLDTASSGSGAAIVQNPISFGPSQSWRLAAAGGGYTLTNLASGLVLDVPGGSTSPGTALDQAAATGAASQQWQFTPVSLIPNGTYTIVNAASGQVFDKFGPTTDYQRIAQNPSTGATNQQWKVTNLGNSIINFADVADNQYVQVIFGTTTPGGQLAGSGNYVGSNAIWQLAPVGGGRVSIIGLASGLPAEDPGGTLTPDTILDIGAPSGAPYQQWTFATAAAISQTVTTFQSQPVGVTLSGTDLNTPAQTLTYAVTSQPAHGTLTGTAPNLTYTPGTGFTGTDSFGFTASDAGSTAPATVTINVAPRATGPVVQINAGGGAVTPFAADTDFSGGTPNSAGATIDVSAANAAPMAVYQTYRYGSFSYTVPGLTAGAGYTVRLHFAETYWNQAGKRIENVTLNGSPALTNFDIFAAAGAENKAVVKTLTATADSSGKITIAIAHANGSPDGNALIAGLEILPIAPPAGSSAPTVATAASASPNPVTGTTTAVSVLGADAGGEPGLTYTWSVTGPAPVTFSPNGTNAAKDSVATFTQAGAYTLTATISDSQAKTATSSVAVTVSQTLTAIAVAPTTTTVTAGQTQQFTATARDQFGVVLSAQPAFTWAATGAGTVSSTGLFTGVSAGPAAVTAASDSVTSLAATVTVMAAASATALSSSLNPSTVSQSVTFTATVTGFSPTGTVTFTVDGTAQPAVALTAGKATFSTASLSVGSHQVSASYSGDGANAAGAAAAITQVVSAAGTTTALTSSLNPSTVGQSITFTATVTGSSPTGTVTFTSGEATLGTGALMNGKATLSTSALAAGARSIVASYGGDGSNAASVSGTLSQTVSPAATTTALSSSANPVASGKSVTFTAMVMGAGPTGTVTFLDGTISLGTGTLTGGVASFSASTLTAGSHSITASYGGDAANAASKSAALAQTVTAVPTDISAQVMVQRAGLVYHSATHQYTQPVRLTNTGKTATPGPVYLVLDGLSRASVLVNRSGVTALTTPAGHPYLLISSKGLTPGAGVIVTLTFTVSPSYTTRVLAGSGSL